LLSVRERFHSVRIEESVTIYSVAVQERLPQSATYFMSHGSDPSSAHMRAVGGAVRRQAFLLGYSHCFLALGCVLLSSAIALFFMKKHVSWVWAVHIDVQQLYFLISVGELNSEVAESTDPLHHDQVAWQCARIPQGIEG
jgi:hypothetical protein